MHYKFNNHYLKRVDFPQYELSEKAYCAYSGGEDEIFTSDDGEQLTGIYIFECGRVQQQSLIAQFERWENVNKFYEQLADELAAECGDK